MKNLLIIIFTNATYSMADARLNSNMPYFRYLLEESHYVLQAYCLLEKV